MTREYRTVAAFKQALEQRLRSGSTSGIDFARRRQLVVFDRFLARIAVELRVERARTTKNVDLRVMGSPDHILDRLRGAAGRDLGDFMVFTIRPGERHPAIQNDGMRALSWSDHAPETTDHDAETGDHGRETRDHDAAGASR